jgi:nicotinamide riboside kinase
VWCEDVFKITPDWLEEKIQSNRYELFLLTRPDIPFKEDAVRENPHRREFFFQWYMRELQQRNFPFEIITGTGAERFENALAAVKKYFSVS